MVKLIRTPCPVLTAIKEQVKSPSFSNAEIMSKVGVIQNPQLVATSHEKNADLSKCLALAKITVDHVSTL